MVIAYHVILSAYGFWLPNDPRGSWSVFVAAWDLFRCGGKATKVDTTRSVARVPHDRANRLGAKRLLKHPAVRWNGRQARAIARGFSQAAGESGYVILACAILEDHVHLIIARTSRPIGPGRWAPQGAGDAAASGGRNASVGAIRGCPGKRPDDVGGEVLESVH